MAGEHELTGADVAAPPWPLLLEIVSATPAGSWVLTGGMMVHLHALRGRVATLRPTRDIDLLLDFEAITHNIGVIAGPLHRLGFRPVEPGRVFHRFRRDDDIVDIMVSNSAGRARWMQHPVMRSAGATLALQDRHKYRVHANDLLFEVPVPSSPAAILLKAVAYRDDQRARGRHLEDLVVLLAADSRAEQDYRSINRAQRRHLDPAVKQLSDSGHPAWQVVDGHDRELAGRAFAALCASR